LKDFSIQHQFAVGLAVEHAEDVPHGHFRHPRRRFPREATDMGGSEEVGQF
jgi:hypothetical protein